MYGATVLIKGTNAKVMPTTTTVSATRNAKLHTNNGVYCKVVTIVVTATSRPTMAKPRAPTNYPGKKLKTTHPAAGRYGDYRHASRHVLLPCSVSIIILHSG